MIKTVTKVGNSHGIIFDNAIMELAHLKAGDQINVEIHAGGTITLTPMKPEPTSEEIRGAIDATMEEYAETMKKLA